jgi:hypothetical protein
MHDFGQQFLISKFSLIVQLHHIVWGKGFPAECFLQSLYHFSHLYSLKSRIAECFSLNIKLGSFNQSRLHVSI